MKKLLLFNLVLLVINCQAQNIPLAVKNAFTKMFPGEIAKKWDKENGIYEANFIREKKSMSATFDAQGKWLETETDIKISELPAAVNDYIKVHYKGARIKEAAIISNATSKKIYEAEVKNKDVLFDANGNFINEKSD